MVRLFDTTRLFSRVLLGNYLTAGDALAAVQQRERVILSAEEDADNPGCWDVAAARGSVLSIYCIEPAGRG
jgi:hypothetical protein